MLRIIKPKPGSVLPENMTHSLAQQLGLAIVTGEYGREGALPSQKVLCDRYKVSCVVVREAIQMLMAKQMLVTRKSQGTRIKSEKNWNLFDSDILFWLTQRDFSPSLLREFNETRIGVEPFIAASMAKNCDIESLRCLEVSLNEVISTNKNGWDMLTVKTQFHMSILAACNNRLYLHLACFIQTAIRYQHLYGASTEGTSFDPSLYQNIYQSISRKDDLGAANSMQILLKSMLDQNQTLLTG